MICLVCFPLAHELAMILFLQGMHDAHVDGGEYSTSIHLEVIGVDYFITALNRTILLGHVGESKVQTQHILSRIFGVPNRQ